MGPGKVNNNHVNQVARWKATKSVATKAMKRKCRSPALRRTIVCCVLSEVERRTPQPVAMKTSRGN